jgi:hypothetical protein
MGMGGGGPGGAGGTPPAACKYDPLPTALSKKLRFERVTLNGLPAQSNDQPYNGGLTEAKFVPGTTDEILIARKGGGLYHFKIAGDAAMMLGSTNVPNVQGREDCGLIGMTFDPDYATNHLLYVGHCVGAAGRESRFMRYTYQQYRLTDGVQVLAVNGGTSRTNSWHSVGSMGFDNNKNLWMQHGEFVTGDPAQDPNTVLGKLLRVQPSRMAGMGGFTPAMGNPAANPVYARGLRSPWRGAYHPGKNWWIVADVGDAQDSFEEVNVITSPGANLGWPMGTCNAGSVACWSKDRTMKIDDVDNLSDTYNSRAGRSSWAGPPYGDCGNDRYGGAMTGVILMGDFFKGWVIGMTLNDSGGKARDANLATFTLISSITQGPDGYLYVTKFPKYHQGATENEANMGLYRVAPM